MPVQKNPDQFLVTTIPESLRYNAIHHKDRTAFVYLIDGETREERISFGELDLRARAIAATLRKVADEGERVILSLPPGPDFLSALCGCFYAGVVALPLITPGGKRNANQVKEYFNRVALDSGAKVVLTGRLYENRLRQIFAFDKTENLDILLLEDVDWQLGRSWTESEVDVTLTEDAVALISYSHNSAGVAPQGVVFTHRNLLYLRENFEEYFAPSQDSLSLSITPLWDGPGLHACLMTLRLGSTHYIMSPAHFARKPERWLKAIDRLGITHTIAPQSAFDLTLRHVSAEESARLNLSSWKSAGIYNQTPASGTMARFSEKFKDRGFEQKNFRFLYFFSGYGGVPADYPGIRIVHPWTLKSETGRGIGEIWLQGPGIPSRFWNTSDEMERFNGFLAPAETGSGYNSRIKRDGPYFRSGDLGAINLDDSNSGINSPETKLNYFGNIRDALFLKARHYSPVEIETRLYTAQNLLIAGGGACFGDDVLGEERLFFVSEVSRDYKNSDLARVCEEISDQVLSEFELALEEIILLPVDALPRTTNGAIERELIARRYRSRKLTVLFKWNRHEFSNGNSKIREGLELDNLPAESGSNGSNNGHGPVSSPTNSRARRPAGALEIEKKLVLAVARRINTNPRKIDVRRPFIQYGLDSAAAISLSGELENILNRKLSPTIVYEYPNIEMLANYLAGGDDSFATSNVLRDSSGMRDRRDNAEPIAIVGMALRFPGASSLDEFWSLLENGEDAVGNFPADRKILYASQLSHQERSYLLQGGYLKNVSLFDPEFFGVSPREAAGIDPQQRFLLEVAHEALEDAGLSSDTIKGSRTGVFVGISNSDYRNLKRGRDIITGEYGAAGNALSIAANRISYLWGLAGPSMAIDTACSSSLVALNLAMDSLRAGKIDAALVGGVNLILTQDINRSFVKAGLISPGGRCRPFDASADGIVRGEGAGMVFIKPLSRAKLDGDNIYAILRGGAVNQDGSTNGLMAPSMPAQRSVLEEAYENARVKPGDVSYVEAHGTGTLLGDPIEAEALGRVLGVGRSKFSPCRLGSVKSNIGHLEAAAGIGGLIKTALMLKKRRLTPCVHFNKENPYIPFEDYNLKVQTKAENWGVSDRQKLLAGVSSFGFGGTNAHVVLESFQNRQTFYHVGIQDGLEKSEEIEEIKEREERKNDFVSEATPHPGIFLLTLSAHTDAALREQARLLNRALEVRKTREGGEGFRHKDLDAMCFAYSRLRSGFNKRIAFVFSNADELTGQIEAWLAGKEVAGYFFESESSNEAGKDLAFVYSGQGAYFHSTGRALYGLFPAFRAVLDELDEYGRQIAGWSILDELFKHSEVSQLQRAEFAQPVLFSLQVALSSLLKSFGVDAVLTLGHSLGEIAAACAAENLSMEDALRVALERGRLIQSVSGNGKLLMTRLPENDVQELIKKYNGDVSIAAVNDPGSTIISGSNQVLEKISGELTEREVYCRSVEGVDFAAHGASMVPVAGELRSSLKRIKPIRSSNPIYSTITGEIIDGDLFTGEYWARNLSERVVFDRTIRNVLENSDVVSFIEIGVHPLFSVSINEIARSEQKNVKVFPTLRRQEDEVRSFYETLARLYAVGFDIRTEALFHGKVDRFPVAPYPYQRRSFWTSRPLKEPVSLEQQNKIRVRKILNSVRKQSSFIPVDLALDSYTERWALLEELTRSYIFRALSEMGLFTILDKNETEIGELIQTLKIPSLYHDLFERWLEQLAEGGILKKSPVGYRPGRTPEKDFVPELLAKTKKLFNESPALPRYLENCGDNLSALIQGKMSPLETLFPNGSYEIADELYHNWSVPAYFNELVTAAVKTLSLKEVNPEDFRILEIGAGTGGTSAAVIPELSPDHRLYYYTDISDFFFARARERFKEFPFVKYALFNAEEDPLEQGLAKGSFDVIIASNVIHALKDIRVALGRIKELLAPGGIFILYEVTTHWPWFDITTGLIEGWRRFNDDLREGAPLLAPEKWSQALRDSGFHTASFYPEVDSPVNILGQHVILGFNSADNFVYGDAGVEEYENLFEANGANEGSEVTKKGNFREELLAASPVEWPALLAEYLRGHLGRVLRTIPEDLDISKPFHKLGFDSLMAVELKNRIETELGVSLSVTADFKGGSLSTLVEILQTKISLNSGIEQGERAAGEDELEAVIPLSPTQHWFFEQNLKDVHHWNASLLLRVEDLQEKYMSRALQIVIESHEVFSYRFRKKGNTWEQFIDGRQNPAILEKSFDFSSLSSEEFYSEVEKESNILQRSLNIQDGPPLAVGYFKTGEHESRILFCVHHLIFDGLSWLIFFQELESVYNKLKNGDIPDPPRQDRGYRKWVKRLIEQADKPDVLAEADYWLGIHKKYKSVLPLDFPEGENNVEGLEYLRFSLTPGESSILLKDLSDKHGFNATELILLALRDVLTEWFGPEPVLIETAGHGRNWIAADINVSRVIGWYTTYYPLLLESRDSPEHNQALRDMTECLKRVPQEGRNYPLLRYLVDDENIQAGLKDSPQPEIKFMYHGHMYDQVTSMDSMFKPARESGGDSWGLSNPQKQMLYVYAYVLESTLVIEILYGKYIFKSERIEKFSENFQARLSELIQHFK